MLNIESKLFKIQSEVGGGYSVTNKRTGAVQFVSTAANVDAGLLAAVDESKFNRIMKDLTNDSKNSV